MSAGNYESRVRSAVDLVKGPLIGDNLLQVLKAEMLKQKVFQVMFGEFGSRIFIDEIPNWNETILPGIIFGWSRETFTTSDAYFTGSISALIALPVKITGDYNAQRKVGQIMQRWMGGPMSLFRKVPGLTMFGNGSEFNYEGLAKFDGFSAPAIQISIPFKFDMQLLQAQLPGFDAFAPLDDADVGFAEQYIVGITNSETEEILIASEAILETGQTN